MSYDTVKYMIKASSGFMLFTLYDTFVSGKDFNSYGMYDAGVFTLSVVAAELSEYLLSFLWDMPENSI